MVEYNPDKRAANLKKQIRFQKSVGKLPGKALQARQDGVVSLVASGESIGSACAKVGVRVNTHEQWRQRWPAHYAQRIDLARAKFKGTFVPEQVPFDPAFRQVHFDYSTPNHLQKLMDVLNEQEDLARSEKSRRRRVLVLMPPEHAKSTMLEDYVTYRISQDPSFRCVLISATLGQARKRTGVIQRRLTERKEFADFIDTYGPFKAEFRIDAKPWTNNYFTVLNAPSDQRDYTLEALGVGGTIYGNRADVIVFDDIATKKNQTPAEIEKQWEWIWGEVRSRLVKGGLFVVIGTRIREGDIYTVMEEKGFFADKVILPAITREPGTLSDKDPGEALWEEENPLQELLLTRAEDPRQFELMYQQNPLPSIGAVFSEEMLRACHDKNRYVGHIPDGTYVVAGVDPSVSNFTAGVVMGVKRSGERFLIDAFAEKGLTGEGGDLQAGVVEFIVELCAKYRVKTLAVENNSWAKLINHSFSLRSKLYDLGVRHLPVAIGPASGVAEEHAVSQLSGLFTNGLISLPASTFSLTHLEPFFHQLLTWTGGKQHWRKNQDIVKAFRMAEHAAKDYLKGAAIKKRPYQEPGRPSYMRERKMATSV